MGNRWTHPVCESCWKIISPAQEPVQMKDPKTTSCCLCGDETISGIFTRIDPSKTMCKGVHPDDETKRLERKP